MSNYVQRLQHHAIIDMTDGQRSLYAA